MEKDVDAVNGEALVWHPSRPRVTSDQRRLASALQNDAGLLELVAGASVEAVAALVGRNRLTPLIARRLRDVAPGSELSRELLSELRESQVRTMLIRHELQQLGAVFGRSGIRWMPLKGGHLAFTVYTHPDDRPMSDIDILVDGTCFREAVDALELAGWRSIGDLGQRYFGYVLEEGYNWPVLRDRIAIEVHFRLWGRAPGAMAPAIFETADQWLEFGDTALRPGLAEAFVVAAAHAWKSPRPRPLLTWWDLRTIVDGVAEPFSEAIGGFARRWDVPMPVGLAAATADALWPHPILAATADSLLHEARGPEMPLKALLRRSVAGALDDRLLVLAHLLAGRRTRLGGKLVWRRFLPHPGLRRRRGE
jgi:hypothetical protein